MIPRPYLLVPITLIGVATAFPAFAADPSCTDPLAILAAARQASGGVAWDAIDSLHRSGRQRQGGQDGHFDELVDLKQVRSVERAVVGPTTDVRGWDGTAGWSLDAAGLLEPGTGAEAVAAGIGMAYRASWAFFWPDRFAASFACGGRTARDGHDYDVVTITPKGADAFDLWIDARTHLVAQEVLGGADPSTELLSDYRSVQGVLLPFSERDSTGEAELDTLSTTTEATVGAALAATAFAPPAAPAEPDPFPAGTDRVVLPISVIDGHVYLPVSIDGGPARRFIFDTGAVAILDKGHALAMGIEPEGAMSGGGFGTATLELNKARVRSIGLGSVTLPGQSVLTLDMTGLERIADVDFAGLLGVEVAQRAVVVIDYERQTMTLIRPSTFKPSPKAIAVPLKFNEHVPMVDATVDGIPGEFEIDTGAGDSLTLMAPFSAAHQLVSRYHATRGAQATGAGGASGAVLARAGTLRIGGSVINGPVTSLGTDTRGATASSRTAGNIGGGILQRFTVTFDYPHRMMYLEPDSHFAAADVFDRSGLKLKRDADGSAVIGFVVAGSGAEHAGLKKGDHVLAVDGVDIHAVALPALRKMFKGAVGTEIGLSVRSEGGQPRDVKVRLGDLV